MLQRLLKFLKVKYDYLGVTMARRRGEDECRTHYGEHKVSYDTWDEAERACYRMWHVAQFRTLFAYRAPCGSYHIGHGALRTRG